MVNGLTITAIFQVVSTLVIAIIGGIFKRELSRLEKADEENKSRMSSIEKELSSRIENVRVENEKCNYEVSGRLNEVKEDINKEFVRKEDYLQTTGEILKRLEKIYDMLYEMKGTVRGG